MGKTVRKETFQCQTLCFIRFLVTLLFVLFIFSFFGGGFLMPDQKIIKRSSIIIFIEETAALTHSKWDRDYMAVRFKQARFKRMAGIHPKGESDCWQRDLVFFAGMMYSIR